MTRKPHPAALIVAAAIAGLVFGYRLAQERGFGKPERAIEELQQADQQVAALHNEIDLAEELLLAVRTNSDSLLRSRWTQRIRYLHTRVSITGPTKMLSVMGPHDSSATETTSATEGIMHATHLLRADDRLIAHLVHERHQYDRLHEHYGALLQSYRRQQALMQENLLRSRRVARKRRRRTIILTAAVATTATLISASN